MPAPKNSGNLPSTSIQTFAEWAVRPEQRAFRLRAVQDLQAAINEFQGDPPLQPDEIEFCEGWLYLARQEIGNVGEDDLDRELVERAQKHLDDGQVHTMSG